MYLPAVYRVYAYTLLSLLYLHTGTPMVGISYPVVWKSSPNRTEIAIISKCNEKEKSLAQFYFEKEEDPYRPPSVTQLCSLAIEIVRIIEKFHSKRVIHGRLRPDVIGVWEVDDRLQVCIRDFSESRILGESGASPEGSSPAEGDILIFPPSAGVHYLPPEMLIANQLGKSHLPVSSAHVSQSIVEPTFILSGLFYTISLLEILSSMNMRLATS